VTLLELVIVLVLMGIGAALVAPMLARPAATGEAPVAAVVARARQAAVRRAEPLRVRLAVNGAWTVTSQRDEVVIDSGRVTGEAMERAWDVDALGGCVPAESAAPRAPFDGLDCGVPAALPLRARGAP
jgi:type II secretory pathway pseudopilin PulG